MDELVVRAARGLGDDLVNHAQFLQVVENPFLVTHFFLDVVHDGFAQPLEPLVAPRSTPRASRVGASLASLSLPTPCRARR